MEEQDNWVYFLKLQKDLSTEYLILDAKLKLHGRSLVPVTLKNLFEIVKSKKTVHLLIVVRTLQEYRYFNKRIKKIMKYLIRTGRVHLYVASSFMGVNDTAIMRRDYYNFVRLPVSYQYLSELIASTIDMSEFGIQKWPGGIRSSYQLTG